MHFIRPSFAGALAVLLMTVALQGELHATAAEPAREFISRAEVVMSMILTRTPDVPAVRNRGQFPDVQRGAWFEPFMLYAVQLGIISPDAEGKLLPASSVTRGEFLRMLTMVFGLPTNQPHSFIDVPADSRFAPYAGLAFTENFLALKDRRHLEPDRIITRPEALAAFALMTRKKQESLRQEQITLDRETAREQAQSKLRLYTVISTRKQNVTLVSVPTEKENTRTPLIRRIRIPPSLPDIRTQILMLVNDVRQERGLHPLTYSSQLEQSAQAFADKMAGEGFFGHIAPDGQTLKDRIQATGFYDRSFSPDCFCVKGYVLGENLARGQKTAKEAFEAWMKSDDHREAILNPDYTVIGIGAKAGIWVQHFGGVLLPGQNVHNEE